MSKAEPRGVSRRALFGAGLGRLLDERLARADRAPAAPAQPVPPAPPPSPLGWGEGDADGLGGRLGEVHDAILAEAGTGPGDRVLVVAAGDGLLALRAAAEGAQVTAVDADPARVARGHERATAAGVAVDWRVGAAPENLPEDGFDAVVSAFGASYGPIRPTAAALVRAVRPGGAIVLTAWTGLVAELGRLARTPDGPRPDAWSRYETAYRHFFDFPGLDVRAATTTWAFADAAEAVAVLGAPAAPHVADRVLAALPELVERHVAPAAGEDDGRLLVRASYALVSARRP
jgi:protein-L-isoaspartate O-methyltransferase